MQANWERFWESNVDGRFTKVSWSKRRIIEILGRHTYRDARVLDAGCGSGFFSKFFIDQGCETYSLDYANESLRITREKTRGLSTAYLCKDLLDPAFADEYAGRFDLVFSDGLFEHFSPSDQDRIMQHFRRVTKSDGLISTFVPNRWSPWTLVRPFFMPGIEEKPFTYRGMKELYFRNQCVVNESGGINVLPIRYSPDALLGSGFGMLIYAIGR